MSKIVSGYNSIDSVLDINSVITRVKINADQIGGLKEEIIKILLQDPDSEVKRIAEDYLIQCVYDATEDPEKNPILHRFFEKNQEEIVQIINEIYQMKNEILQVKSELQELKNKLGVDPNYYTSNGVAWKDDVGYQIGWIEEKLINITKKLEKAGIDINYWEN